MRSWNALDPGLSKTTARTCRAFLLCALIGLLTTGSALARAEGESEDAVDPRSRLSLFLDAAPHVVIQRAKSGVSTNFGLTSNKANIVTNMTFRLGGGLKGPAIEAIPGKPRPVVWGAALVPLNESSTIGARFFLDESRPGFQSIEFSKFSIEYQTSGIVGLGIEFEVPILSEGAISITPALESLHLVTRYVGEADIQTNSLGNSEVHDVRLKDEITQHFLGPSLRIGAPAIVVRGVAIHFFVNGSILFDVAGTRRELNARGQNGDSGRFSFETGSGVVQVGSGIQVRFP